MVERIEELDVVALTVDLPEHKLVRGQVGTVVMLHGAEVEFVDETGRTYALLTLPTTQLLRLYYHQTEAA